MPHSEKTQTICIIPVLPSADIVRDIAWYEEKTGFKPIYQDKMYAVLQRENLYLHLQWHADTADDPLLGGSVIRIFTKNIQPLFRELVERGAVHSSKFVSNTRWNTNEFGFYDLKVDSIFVIEEVKGEKR